MGKQDSHKNRAPGYRETTLDCIESLKEAVRILEKIANPEIKIEPMKWTPKCEIEVRAKEAYPWLRRYIMVFRCVFASLAVGDGTALKLEHAQNVEANEE